MSDSRNIKVLLYYPVYVNTYALTYLLPKESTPEDTFEYTSKYFNWNEVVPSGLEDELKSGEYDIIYCFTSEEKQPYFRHEVKELLVGHEKYKISNELKNSSISDDIIDINYSNFFFKYIFFRNKVNVKEIHNLAKEFYGENGKNPYLSKLLSFLLSRGYQTIRLDSDSGDEAKGMLRKLLHEEYGFKFKLTPISSLSYQENTTLTIEAKGGQQSFEEVNRQSLNFENVGHSDKITFEIPPNKKFTSKTNLIIIYNRKEDKVKESISEIKKLIEQIFPPGKIDIDVNIFEKITENFVKVNLEFIVQEIENTSGSDFNQKFEKVKKENTFLQSLQYYSIAEDSIKKDFENYIKTRKKGELEKIKKKIEDNSDYLQIKTKEHYIQCLQNHDLKEGLSFNVKLNDSFEANFDALCVNLKDIYKDKPNSLDTALKGMSLLKYVIENPNGIAQKKNEEEKRKSDSEVKKEISEILNNLKKPSESDSIGFDKKFNNFYNTMRIIAEDLNFIVEEGIWGDPKHLLENLHGLDISEFEYLFSIDFSKKINQFY